MSDRFTDQAIEWHIALERGDADWDGFTRWLEADPRHRPAYDAIAALDDRLLRHRAALRNALGPVHEAAAATQSRRRGRLPWLAGGGAAAAAVAASLVVLVSIGQQSSPAPVIYRTAAGETRQVALADGSTILLSASSRLAIAGKAQDDLTLDGAALFAVPHRADRALVIHADGVAVQDIGTRFDIVTGGGAVRVAVAEGEVMTMLPNRQRIAVPAGKRLLVNRAGRSAELRPLALHEFGSWRQGRLVYDDVPLPLVATDVSRYSGRTVTLDPAILDRRFSGVLTIGDGSELVGNLAQFMDLDLRPEGKSVRLVPRRRR